MYRDIVNQLVEWKKSEERKPLVVLGARQVGKTYSLLDFGKQHYKYVAYRSEVGRKLEIKVVECFPCSA